VSSEWWVNGERETGDRKQEGRIQGKGIREKVVNGDR